MSRVPNGDNLTLFAAYRRSTLELHSVASCSNQADCWSDYTLMSELQTQAKVSIIVMLAAKAKSSFDAANLEKVTTNKFDIDG